jgi:fatty acid/phospholipid biosynthesis enzyme
MQVSFSGFVEVVDVCSNETDLVVVLGEGVET